jgi:cytosine/uracil/thiamine/allantoin permease
MVMQSLLLWSVLTLCCGVAAAPIGLVRDYTEGAPAEKSCRVGNGLGIVIAAIVRAFWGFIVIIITTLTTQRSNRLENTAAMGAKHGANAD